MLTNPLVILGLACFLLSSIAEGVSLQNPLSMKKKEAQGPVASSAPKTSSEEQEPWFTGPLLIPVSDIIEIGHFNVEPFLFFTTFYGVYGSNWKSHRTTNFYSLNMQVPVQIGIAKCATVFFTPQGFYNWTHEEHSSEFGDIPFGINFGLLSEKKEHWHPAILLSLYASAPTGKYDRLNHRKRFTDAAGSGSWEPGIGLIFCRHFYFAGAHCLHTMLQVAYTIPTSTHVHGLNVYGGGDRTKGSLRPGNSAFVDFAFEYSFTRNWAMACDFVYQHDNRSSFHGDRGFEEDGNQAQIGLPSQDQFSIAPAIEYNWSEHIGLIGGVWATVAGRNTAQFVSGVIALNIYY